jgi:hypothetical protein
MPYNKHRYPPVLLQGADLVYLMGKANESLSASSQAKYNKFITTTTTTTTTYYRVGWIDQLFPWSVYCPSALLFIVFYMAALFRSLHSCLLRLLGMLGETLLNSLIINHQTEERSKHLVCVPV